MVVDKTLAHNRNDLYPFLGFRPEERPLVAQLGGNDVEGVTEAAKMVEQQGYDEVNINCGCPSKTVSNGCFGARLMFDGKRVHDLVRSMKDAVTIPVHIKCRIGVDHQDSYEELHAFVQLVSEAGCTHFIIHARKAILGLNTTQNRNIPPLKYDWVFRLKRDFPEFDFTLNGGVQTLDQVHSLLAYGEEHGTPLEGVMIGRVAYSNPWLFADVDRQFYNEPNPGLSRREVVQAYAAYCEEEQAEHGVPNSVLLKPAQCLMSGCRGNKQWRQFIDVNMRKNKGAGCAGEVLLKALDVMNDEILDVRAPEGEFDGKYTVFDWEHTEKNSQFVNELEGNEAKEEAKPPTRSMPEKAPQPAAVQEPAPRVEPVSRSSSVDGAPATGVVPEKTSAGAEVNSEVGCSPVLPSSGRQCACLW